MTSPIAFFQPLGRALMLPIAVLPVAGLLLRLGQPDLLDVAFLAAAGDAIFQNLGLLFAVGVATGFARDGNGAASLASVVCFLIATRGAQIFLIPPAEIVAGLADQAQAAAVIAWRGAAIAKLEVPIGIASGLIGGGFYNRFSAITFPDYLAFFGGRRFVPIISGLAGLVIALLLGFGYAQINTGMDSLSHAITASGSIGLLVYGVLNRLLLVTGLHHLLNNVVWFLLGDYGGATGDLRRFFAGDPGAGGFMSGFFPVMMFGLPAACIAMYRSAAPSRRAAVSGLFFSLGLTSFLTGVTEPIEFTFMFLAPALYAVHALMTGLSAVLMDALGIRLGFGFSAGLFDYVLNFGKATRPLLLLPIGLAYGVIYYAIFRWAIVRFDLPTPGREPEETSVDPAEAMKGTDRGIAFLEALGGASNLVEVGACTTRLRLVVVRQDAIDEPRLKALGSRGVLRRSRTAVQVVVGPIADAIAMELRTAIDRPPPVAPPPSERKHSTAILPAGILEAVGGAGNIAEREHYHGRLRIRVVERDLVATDRLAAAGARAVSWVTNNVVHVLQPEHADA